jgi:hypothetical protein
MKEQLQKELYDLVQSGIKTEIENYTEKFTIRDKKIIVEDSCYIREYKDTEDFEKIINIDTLEFLINELNKARKVR